jgi:3-ketosteroid 9alpha-monooxygenase subunit A
VGDIPAAMMKPSGWFQVGWSSDFTSSELVSRRFFGRDLVMRRDADGELVAMDAYCGHMGAHLGDGQVCERSIVCPFHGWEWDHDGRNVSIPYQDRPNRVARLDTLPMAERNGIVYLWHHPDGAEPSWTVPDAVETFDGDVRDGNSFHPCHPHGQIDYGVLDLNPYVVMDNVADAAHFTFVHAAPDIPTVVFFEPDGAIYHVRLGFGDAWGSGARDAPGMRLDIDQAGVGLSYTAFGGGGVPWTLILLGTTPVDDTTSAMFQSIWLQELPGDDDPDQMAKRIRQASHQLPRDIDIWEKQRYFERPAWAASEVRGFQALRRWAAQFHSPEH